jgi:hypothetical protein
MKNLRDRKKKKKKKKKRKKKNLLSFQGPSPLVCPITTVDGLFRVVGTIGARRSIGSWLRLM